MSHLFLLTYKKYFFSAYYNNKSIVISSPDEQKLDMFHHTIKKHKAKYNKWLNNGINISYGPEKNKEIFDLTETNTKTNIDKYTFVPTYIDINNETDVKFVHQMYELANVELFMMYEFSYIETIPLLSLQGVRIEKPEIVDHVFDEHTFLNAIFELDTD